VGRALHSKVKPAHKAAQLSHGRSSGRSDHRTGTMVAAMPKSKTRNKKSPTRSQREARPQPKRKLPSPKWYVITMFSLMGLGVLVAILSHAVPFFRGWGMWVGLSSLAAGFLMTLNYR